MRRIVGITHPSTNHDHDTTSNLSTPRKDSRMPSSLSSPSSSATFITKKKDKNKNKRRRYQLMGISTFLLCVWLLIVHITILYLNPTNGINGDGNNRNMFQQQKNVSSSLSLPGATPTQQQQQGEEDETTTTSEIGSIQWQILSNKFRPERHNRTVDGLYIPGLFFDDHIYLYGARLTTYYDGHDHDDYNDYNFNSNVQKQSHHNEEKTNNKSTSTDKTTTKGRRMKDSLDRNKDYYINNDVHVTLFGIPGDLWYRIKDGKTRCQRDDQILGPYGSLWNYTYVQKNVKMYVNVALTTTNATKWKGKKHSYDDGDDDDETEFYSNLIPMDLIPTISADSNCNKITLIWDGNLSDYITKNDLKQRIEEDYYYSSDSYHDDSSIKQTVTTTTTKGHQQQRRQSAIRLQFWIIETKRMTTTTTNTNTNTNTTNVADRRKIMDQLKNFNNNDGNTNSNQLSKLITIDIPISTLVIGHGGPVIINNDYTSFGSTSIGETSSTKRNNINNNNQTKKMDTSMETKNLNNQPEDVSTATSTSTTMKRREETTSSLSVPLRRHFLLESQHVMDAVICLPVYNSKIGSRGSTGGTNETNSNNNDKDDTTTTTIKNNDNDDNKNNNEFTIDEYLHYIPEFILHHTNIGFEHIIIGVIDSTMDGSTMVMLQDMLSDFIQRGLVSLAPAAIGGGSSSTSTTYDNSNDHNDNTNTNTNNVYDWHCDVNIHKVLFLNSCLYHTKGIAKHVGVWDLDEYWIPPSSFLFPVVPSTTKPSSSTTATTTGTSTSTLSYIQSDPIWKQSNYSTSISISSALKYIHLFHQLSSKTTTTSSSSKSSSSSLTPINSTNSNNNNNNSIKKSTTTTNNNNENEHDNENGTKQSCADAWCFNAYPSYTVYLKRHHRHEYDYNNDDNNDTNHFTKQIRKNNDNNTNITTTNTNQNTNNRIGYIGQDFQHRKVHVQTEWIKSISRTKYTYFVGLHEGGSCNFFLHHHHHHSSSSSKNIHQQRRRQEQEQHQQHQRHYSNRNNHQNVSSLSSVSEKSSSSSSLLLHKHPYYLSRVQVRAVKSSNSNINFGCQNLKLDSSAFGSIHHFQSLAWIRPSEEQQSRYQYEKEQGFTTTTATSIIAQSMDDDKTSPTTTASNVTNDTIPILQALKRRQQEQEQQQQQAVTHCIESKTCPVDEYVERYRKTIQQQLIAREGGREREIEREK